MTRARTALEEPAPPTSGRWRRLLAFAASGLAAGVLMFTLRQVTAVPSLPRAKRVFLTGSREKWILAAHGSDDRGDPTVGRVVVGELGPSELLELMESPGTIPVASLLARLDGGDQRQETWQGMLELSLVRRASAEQPVLRELARMVDPPWEWAVGALEAPELTRLAELLARRGGPETDDLWVPLFMRLARTDLPAWTDCLGVCLTTARSPGSQVAILCAAWNSALAVPSGCPGQMALQQVRSCLERLSPGARDAVRGRIGERAWRVMSRASDALRGESGAGTSR